MKDPKFFKTTRRCKNEAGEKSYILFTKEDIRINYNTEPSTLENQHLNIPPNGEQKMFENEQSKMLGMKWDKEKTLKKTEVYFAVSLCVFAVAIYSVSFISVQYLSGAVPENELNSWRFLAAAIMSAPFVTKTNSKILVPKSKWHIFLAICVYSGNK